MHFKKDELISQPWREHKFIERVSNEYPNHKVLARRIDRIYKFAMRKKNNT